MPFYAKVRKGDNMVVGTTVLDVEQAVKFPSDADVALIEITEAEHTTANSGLRYPGSDIFRFSWDGTQFLSNPDTRPLVSFTPTEIKAEVGEAVTVGINHATAGTGLREFVLAGVPTRVDFVNGVATVAIATDEPGQFTIDSGVKFRVAAPLAVTVYTRKLGRK